MRVAPRRLPARLAYEVGTIVGRSPALALPIARWRGHGELVGTDTDIVIEGYPRSANSFAVAALAAAQPGPVRIAHHTHSPAHVIAAVRRNLPVLVVIRAPEEAVVEMVAAKPSLTVGQALRGYVRFYRPLLPYRGRFVVARASDVTTGFGAVVRRVNERFGTSFREFEGTDETVATVRRGMEGYWKQRSGPGLPLVGRTGEGEGALEDPRDRLRREYREARLSRLRARAERLHGTLTQAG